MPIACPVALPPLEEKQVKGPIVPLCLSEVQKLLPFRISLKDLPCVEVNGSIAAGSDDSSDKQLQKDFSRDRIILQGRRYQVTYAIALMYCYSCALRESVVYTGI